MKKWYKITYSDGTKKTIGEVKGSILHMTRLGSEHMWNGKTEQADGGPALGWGLSMQVLQDQSLAGVMILDKESDTHYLIERSTWEPIVAFDMYMDRLTHNTYGEQVIFSLKDFSVLDYSKNEGSKREEDEEEIVRMRHITSEQALFLLLTNHEVYRQRQTLIHWKDVHDESLAVFTSHDHFVKEDPA